MQCLSCGTKMQADETRCPSCGTPAPQHSLDTSPYDLDGETLPYISYSPSISSSTASSSSLSYNPQPLLVSNVPPQQALVQEKPVQHSGILTSTAVLLIILALLIIGNASGLMLYATLLHPAELRVQATAVTQRIFAAQMQATATANTQSPQRMYNQITKTSPSFSDPLDGQHSSLWSREGQGNTSCTFTNGAYHMHVAPKDFYFYCPAAGNRYNNFILQMQITIITGLDAGFIFYAGNQNALFPSYIFTFTHTGLYTLGVSNDPQHGKTLVFGRSSAIIVGLNQHNLVAVMARNGNISLFINKQFVTSVHDDTYKSGMLGLIAGNLPRTNVDVAFSNAQIWSLPDVP